MSVFDLLFLSLVLVGVVSLLTAGGLALSGRGTRALRILRRVGLGAVLYLGVVLVVSPLVPRRVLAVGEPLCFDDWCLTVESVQRAAPAASALSTPSTTTGVEHVVELRLSSRARGVTQRERGVAVCLVDASGGRHDPLPDASAVPLDTALEPGQSVLARRTFVLPPDEQAVGLVVSHRGFPIRWLLIGEGPFRADPIVELGGGSRSADPR